MKKKWVTVTVTKRAVRHGQVAPSHRTDKKANGARIRVATHRDIPALSWRCQTRWVRRVHPADAAKYVNDPVDAQMVYVCEHQISFRRTK